MIEIENQELSISKQCELLNLSRSTLYYHPKEMSEYNLKLMDLLDKQYTKTPYYGSRKMTKLLIRKGYKVNRKRIQRLMGLMGLCAIYPKKNLSKPGAGHKIYPYLLSDKEITGVNQVWSTDITYIKLKKGFIYLVAVMDWYSRYVLSWKISISLEADFCIKALEEALNYGKPEIFNTDQGSQFTSNDFISVLVKNRIKISMDGKGRALDNIFVERLWRTVKYEEVYLKDYETVIEAVENISKYFDFYNNERIHQSLDYETPAEIHFADQNNTIENLLRKGA